MGKGKGWKWEGRAAAEPGLEAGLRRGTAKGWLEGDPCPLLIRTQVASLASNWEPHEEVRREHTSQPKGNSSLFPGIREWLEENCSSQQRNGDPETTNGEERTRGRVHCRRRETGRTGRSARIDMVNFRTTTLDKSSQAQKTNAGCRTQRQVWL